MDTTPNLKTVGIGNREAPKLSAVACVVQDTEIKLVGQDNKKAQKVIFHLAHPAKDELISVSAITLLRQRKDKKEIVSSGAWVNLDEDNKLQKDSALAVCLRFYGVNNLAEMTNKVVQTELGTDGYLTIKAY